MGEDVKGEEYSKVCGLCGGDEKEWNGALTDLVRGMKVDVDFFELDVGPPVFS